MTGSSVVVWTGRLVGTWPGGLDNWDTARRTVRESFDTAEVLVLADPPSFHYPWLWGAPGLPLVIVPPTGLSISTVVGMLGPVLFDRITPYDRVLVQQPGLRDAFEELYEVPAEVWVEAGGSDWVAAVEKTLADLSPLADLAAAKRSWFDRVAVAIEELRTGLRWGPNAVPEARLHSAGTPTVALDGEAHYWTGHLERRAKVFITSLDDVLSPAVGALPSPAPDAAILVLPDGGQDPQARIARIREAFQVLPPGGQLLIDAHVVDTDDGRRNPSIGQLIEEIHWATGTAVHLESLRSARRRGERMARGVLLRFTSLNVRTVLS